MLRTIRNIFILILIGITASGMPIYASSFNYSALISTIIPKDHLIIGTTDEKIISNNQNSEDKEFDLDKSEFNITLNSEGTYISALSNPVAGQIPLTLYFPDDDLMYLVPITRFVPYTSSPLTRTLRNLEKGPSSELGLLNDSPIPPNGKAGRVGNIAYVNLPADLGPYDGGSGIATIAVNSLVNSLTSTDGINKVQFQFNGRVVKDAFHGLSMDKPYNKFDEPMIYTAYLSTNNRYLLTPIPFGRFGTVTEQYNESIKIPTIFDTLKFKDHGVYNSKIHPIVSNEVELLDYRVSNGILTLTFNESFEKAYEDNKQLHQMMIDGIVFTFMSLEDVDSINFQVKLDSKDLKNQEIINYDFTLPAYINPEI